MGQQPALASTWGSQKMDEFVAWISKPGTPSGYVGPKAVEPAKAREHIENILRYIEQVEKLAKSGNPDAVDLLTALSPVRTLLSAARTGAEIAEAAQASDGYLRTYVALLEQREGDKMAARDDRSWQAEDQRFIGYARVVGQQQNLARRVISYDNPEGTSIPQLMACQIQRDFIHKIKFWQKTHELRYAPCDSIRYLLNLSGK